MPEGHTLHRHARMHHRRYAGHPVAVSSPQGRFAAQASILDGRKLVRAEAHGKHLFHVYGPDAVVHIHLGLLGIFGEHKLPLAEPVGQVRMRVVGRTHWTDLRGPNACELWTQDQVTALRARLGPDPLRRDADPDKAWQRISRSRVSLAALLMDQAVIAGVGNVYRAEVLFRHGIPPLLPGRQLDQTLYKEIWDDLVDLMNHGVKAGQIDTVRPEHMPEVMGREPRKDAHGGEVYVYRRDGLPCYVCATPVAKAELAGRNLFWCPTCQPE
ncbi:Fpg/Nei family DNA glycosylase [Kibdelosporangium phytohabitans]|uniref:DNA-(apurinic or apyrimidinic site) lyase n=1 Tax=Kibdelosporangium phytohabitans TaxID=860235 RepID=A0A0N9HV73_9PSEU|nr:zinc finger domain-containing protein [Kibdelosporangium phytohabitans]ALG07435.1 DNA glycosylase [Kibdelosporangium phytohabitans]MBE1471671.1 endonuclease-8 [Kibdelosporangium phytohabitans]